MTNIYGMSLMHYNLVTKVFYFSIVHHPAYNGWTVLDLAWEGVCHCHVRQGALVDKVPAPVVVEEKPTSVMVNEVPAPVVIDEMLFPAVVDEWPAPVMVE